MEERLEEFQKEKLEFEKMKLEFLESISTDEKSNPTEEIKKIQQFKLQFLKKQEQEKANAKKAKKTKGKSIKSPRLDLKRKPKTKKDLERELDNDKISEKKKKKTSARLNGKKVNVKRTLSHLREKQRTDEEDQANLPRSPSKPTLPSSPSKVSPSSSPRQLDKTDRVEKVDKADLLPRSPTSPSIGNALLSAPKGGAFLPKANSNMKVFQKLMRPTPKLRPAFHVPKEIHSRFTLPAPKPVLKLTKEQLPFLPPEFYGDAYTQIATNLNLSQNYIESLPDEFAQFTNLIELDLSYNRFKSFPKMGTTNLKVLLIEDFN
uniref:Uncharacterized protein n=1 Tax=Arcella intermedia TaxID=1963864 RepID=A0A6B2L9V3_9EUKA